jgi:hypothetical protein
MCEKEKISLIVTEEQKETLLSMFGYYGWDVDGVNDSKVTQVNEATQTDEITEESDGGAVQKYLYFSFLKLISYVLLL